MNGQKWSIGLQLVTLVAVIAVGWGVFKAHVDNEFIHQDPGTKREIARHEASTVVAPIDARVLKLETAVNSGVLPVADQKLKDLDRRMNATDQRYERLIQEIAEIKAILQVQNRPSSQGR